METLSLRDRPPMSSRLSNHSRYLSRTPRLPTPETSRSSGSSYDSADPPRRARRGSMEFKMADRPSPPYHASDPLKPSLPPLKTVLGDNMTSPPATPRFRSNAVQPSPFEPSYTTATYKPPSLYPNKRPKTDLLLQPFVPYSGGLSQSSVVSPETRPRPSISLPRSSSSYDVSGYRRDLSQAQPRVSPGAAGPPSTRLPPSHYTGHPYGTPVQTPTSTTFDRSYLCSAASSSELRERALPSHSHRTSLSRRPSFDVYGTRAVEVKHARHHDAHHEMHDHYRPYSDASRIPRDFAPPYPAPYDRDFVAGHYDYQHGKARKRSNLPKQSTEIMKQWFDQNLSNPYPSEEQKALFSTATGISMTQVSNWFINHRRRCPELRDKRDRTRRDGDV